MEIGSILIKRLILDHYKGNNLYYDMLCETYGSRNEENYEHGITSTCIVNLEF